MRGGKSNGVSLSGPIDRIPRLPRYQSLARRNPSKKSRESKSKWTKEKTTGETDALSRGQEYDTSRRIGEKLLRNGRDLWQG